MGVIVVIVIVVVEEDDDDIVTWCLGPFTDNSKTKSPRQSQ